MPKLMVGTCEKKGQPSSMENQRITFFFLSQQGFAVLELLLPNCIISVFFGIFYASFGTLGVSVCWGLPNVVSTKGMKLLFIVEKGSRFAQKMGKLGEEVKLGFLGEGNLNCSQAL